MIIYKKCYCFFAFTIFTLFTLQILSIPARGLAGQSELLVSAAISLKDAFEEMAKNFEKHYAVKINFNFGASGTLQKQIEYGAPVDVYASAAEKQMDILENKSLILEGTRKNFARNAMIIIQSKSSEILLNSIYDLTNPEIKIVAIGNPNTVPAGYYARELLETLGLWQRIQPKLIYAQNVQHVFVFTGRGEADVGFVYQSDIYKDKEKRLKTIYLPLDSQPSILYPIAVVRDSRVPDLATRFVELVTSETGKRILVKSGFQIP